MEVVDFLDGGWVEGNGVVYWLFLVVIRYILCNGRGECDRCVGVVMLIGFESYFWVWRVKCVGGELIGLLS